ncbi:MAG TPA: DinB family protein [Acidimicrobiales bacterium]|nr:DinB family protein [Acidimicrobiales bacterium]
MPEHPDARNAPAIVDGEIETQLAFLGYLRQSVTRKLVGLTEEQARRALVPSGTSLLGLVKHLTEVEIYWIQRRFSGLDVDLDTDAFTVTDDDTVAAVVDAYDRAAARTDEIARTAADPDRPLARGTQGLTLRWVLVHVTEETARHAGHADIVRELIDGATGR